jgi:hypothetical protein
VPQSKLLQHVLHGPLYQHLYPLPRQYNRRKDFSQGHSHKFLSNLHLLPFNPLLVE